MMELAWRYSAVGERGEPLEGIVYASSLSMAYFQVKRAIDRKPGSVRIAVWESIDAAWSRDFSGRDLALFYRTLGARLERGHSVEEGLEDARDFVFDRRMSQAIGHMLLRLRDGVTLGEAMRLAGFSSRDAALVSGMTEAGRLPEALAGLALELEQAESIGESVRSLLRMPIAVVVVMYLGFYAALTVFMPGMRRFYEALGTVKLPPAVTYAYDLSAAFNAHSVVATSLYVALPLLTLAFVRSAAGRRSIEYLPACRRLAERADMSRLWAGFSVLYDAGVNVEEACRLLAAAARRTPSQACFRALGRQLNVGASFVAAASHAGFPAYVVKGIQAADSGGDLVSGTRALAERLAQDVAFMARRLEHVVRLSACLAIAVGVAIFFLVTYYPILGVTLNLV